MSDGGDSDMVERGKKRDIEEGETGNLKNQRTDICTHDINNHSVPKDTDKILLEDTQEYSMEDDDDYENVTTEHLEQTEDNSLDLKDVDKDVDKDITLHDSSGTLENSQGFSPTLDDNDEKLKVEEEVMEEMNDGNGERFSLIKVSSVQRDAEYISSIIPGVVVGQVYDKILENREKSNRLELVTNEVLEGNVGANPAESESEDAIFKDVAEVLVVYPNSDPNEIFDMLEKCDRENNRVKEVIDSLAKQVSTAKLSSSSTNDLSKKEPDLLSDPTFKSNPLYRDVRTLHRALPDKDPNEIYAYLEAHFDKANRVQIVLEELTKSDSQEDIPVSAKESLEKTEEKGKGPMVSTEKIQVELHELRYVFPDCDPNFLYQKLDENSSDPDRVGKIATELFETKKYPKVSEILKDEKRNTLKRKYSRLLFNLKVFTKKFPNAMEYFANEERPVSTNYRDHVLVYLKNQYPFAKNGFLEKVLDEHKFHLSSTVVALDEALTDIRGGRSKKLRRTPRTGELDYPEEPDEIFFHEVMFCQHKQQIKDYSKEQVRLKEERREAAREQGELMECSCCFDDECLFEDMQACGDGHLFCRECIFRSCESAIGQGKVEFLCLTGTCEHQFPIPVLQKILPPNLLSLALRKMQEEEIRQADIPDLVTCPFCPFATIMSNPDDKVFKCLSSDCLKESCRLCKEPNHIPLHCDEVEKQGETSMRAYIERKMSEAMLRECHSCKKRFYKTEGCNKMTCACGAAMCYVCRAPDIDYSHFQQGCPIDSNINGLHKEEMIKAAENAKQKYLKDHPETADTELKYDPIKLVEKMMEQGRNMDNDDGYDDEEDDYSDDDYDN